MENTIDPREDRRYETVSADLSESQIGAMKRAVTSSRNYFVPGGAAPHVVHSDTGITVGYIGNDIFETVHYYDKNLERKSAKLRRGLIGLAVKSAGLGEYNSEGPAGNGRTFDPNL